MIDQQISIFFKLGFSYISAPENPIFNSLASTPHNKYGIIGVKTRLLKIDYSERVKSDEWRKNKERMKDR